MDILMLVLVALFLVAGIYVALKGNKVLGILLIDVAFIVYNPWLAPPMFLVNALAFWLMDRNDVAVPMVALAGVSLVVLILL